VLRQTADDVQRAREAKRQRELRERIGDRQVSRGTDLTAEQREQRRRRRRAERAARKASRRK
jgi:hypothetical protein